MNYLQPNPQSLSPKLTRPTTEKLFQININRYIKLSCKCKVVTYLFVCLFVCLDVQS